MVMDVEQEAAEKGIVTEAQAQANDVFRQQIARREYETTFDPEERKKRALEAGQKDRAALKSETSKSKSKV